MTLRTFKHLNIFVGFSALFSNMNETDKAVSTCRFRNAKLWSLRSCKLFYKSRVDTALSSRHKRTIPSTVPTATTALGPEHLLLQQRSVIV